MTDLVIADELASAVVDLLESLKTDSVLQVGPLTFLAILRVEDALRAYQIARGVS